MERVNKVNMRAVDLFSRIVFALLISGIKVLSSGVVERASGLGAESVQRYFRNPLFGFTGSGRSFVFCFTDRLGDFKNWGVGNFTIWTRVWCEDYDDKQSIRQGRRRSVTVLI